ncbi:MAG: tRNA 2-thiouridine(34) synthase MnmA [Anaerolineales bacterium]
MTNNARVVVAMSGGVDSSVAAALLKERGYDVIGMMLRLWSEPGSEADNRCCTPDAMALARRVAAKLSIPFYAIDARQVFHDTVVQYFYDGYAQGITPNPCLVCNRQVRWEFLLNHALALGAQYLATGHYTRLTQDAQGRIQVLRAVDDRKDQSYVLHVLRQEQLQHALFPLGEYTKPQVRQLARDFDLPVSERSDSQDLCFIGNEDYRQFLSRRLPQVNQPGPIRATSGERLGEHQGLAFYTIGQRKGLGIAAAQPLYVLEKKMDENTLVVGTAAELGRQELTAKEVNWIRGQAPVEPLRAAVKIRYRAREVQALVEPLPVDRAYVRFDEPLRDITPGQAAVFYQGDLCLGGGLIE